GTQSGDSNAGVTPTATFWSNSSSHSHPVAGQPTGSGKLSFCTQLPEDLVKPINFNFKFYYKAMEPKVSQIDNTCFPKIHQLLNTNFFCKKAHQRCPNL